MILLKYNSLTTIVHYSRWTVNNEGIVKWKKIEKKQREDILLF